MTENLQKDLLLAILAMDSYNQGYDPGLNHGKAQIGTAERSVQSDIDSESDEYAAGFYAVSYDTPYGTIISYRGTDKNAIDLNPWSDEPGSDLWNGYGTGAGSSNNIQAHFAAEFYQAVTGTSDTDPRTGSAILTGHSLGGGLAGLVGALYGKEAVLFDNMPFELAAKDAYAEAATWLINPVSLVSRALWGDFYNEMTPWAPVIGDNLKTIAVTGEFLSALRIFQETEQTYLDSYAGFTLDPLAPFFKFHSMSLLVSLLFADQLVENGGSYDWRNIAPDLWDAYFDNDLALLAGFAKENEGGASTAAGKLSTAIAYSALDEGTLVFGNTGIRAMFDDANELGKLVAEGRVPSALENAISGVTEAIVQFAGQMALNEVRYQDHADWSPEKGFLGLNDEQTVLKLDLARELWNLGGNDPDREVQIKGVQSILDSFFDKSPSSGHVTDNESELLAAMLLLYGSSETSIVDRIDFALGTGDLTLELEERGESTDSYNPDTVGVFAALDGNDHITGNSDNNIIVGGEGDDRLVGGLGKDIVIGGLGSDVLVDLFGVSDDSGSRLNESDVYIGEPSDKSLLLQFYEWLAGDQPEDAVEYSALGSSEPDAELLAKGVVIEDIALDDSSFGDAEAVKLTLKDLNSGADATDYLINIDRVRLSERKDRAVVASDWLNVPILLDFGGFAEGNVSKDDWDEIDFSSLSSGITMVNGTTRNRSDQLPDLAAGMGGFLGELATFLPYLFGFAPDILALGSQENNNALRFTGAEKIIGTDHSDVLWFGTPGLLDRYLGGWPDDLEKPAFAEIDGGKGNDRIVFHDGQYVGAEDVIPEIFGGAGQTTNPDTGEHEGGSIAATEIRTVINGGEGDDRLYAAGGIGTVVAGGEGRDFLFNTSLGGQIYGDTKGGTDGEFYSKDNPREHSDVFWYWPGTFIQDARPNDIIQTFGIPLTGGTNVPVLGGDVFSLLAFLGQLTDFRISLDFINPFISYAFSDSGQLFIHNRLPGAAIATTRTLEDGTEISVDPRLSRVQVVENYDRGAVNDTYFNRNDPGDLGLTFRIWGGTNVPVLGGDVFSGLSAENDNSHNSFHVYIAA